jgi:cytoskeletal protein CcmA (bactofilin family)
MTCPGEPTLALLADGELAGVEARGIETHLAACSSCRSLLEALRGEGRLLARVLEEGALEPAGQGASSAELAAAAVALLVAAAAGLQVGSRWVGWLGDQATFGLLDTRTLLWSAFFETFFYLLREGASMLNSLLTVVGFLVGALTLAALAHLLRRRSPRALLLATAVAALPADAATALERRAAEKGEVVVPAGETIDDTLLATGETVTVDGVVNGNLLAFAHKVSVRGTVKGDLITAAQRVELTGTVEGNVFSGSEDVALRGRVLGGAHAAAKRVAIEREARVRGDLIAFAQDAELEGGFERDVLVFAHRTALRGEVARNASVWTDQLDVVAPARVGGDLIAHVENPDHVRVATGATVAGRVETRHPEPKRRGSPYARPSFYVWKAIWLAAAFVTGLVLRRLWPWLFAYGPATPAALGRPLGVGFLVLAATPLAVVIVGLTVIGLPLALLALGAWLAALYLSGIVTGALLGSLLLGRQDATPPSARALFVGLLVLTVAAAIPWLGGLVRLAALLLGLGIAVIQARRAWRSAPAL